MHTEEVVFPCFSTFKLVSHRLAYQLRTHGSESRGQEEAGKPKRRTSELFTGSTALNFVYALNKPPLNIA